MFLSSVLHTYAKIGANCMSYVCRIEETKKVNCHFFLNRCFAFNLMFLHHFSRQFIPWKIIVIGSDHDGPRYRVSFLLCSAFVLDTSVLGSSFTWCFVPHRFMFCYSRKNVVSDKILSLCFFFIYMCMFGSAWDQLPFVSFFFFHIHSLVSGVSLCLLQTGFSSFHKESSQ
jgi:hypothetical protein